MHSLPGQWDSDQFIGLLVLSTCVLSLDSGLLSGLLVILSLVCAKAKLTLLVDFCFFLAPFLNKLCALFSLGGKPLVQCMAHIWWGTIIWRYDREGSTMHYADILVIHDEFLGSERTRELGHIKRYVYMKTNRGKYRYWSFVKSVHTLYR